MFNAKNGQEGFSPLLVLLGILLVTSLGFAFYRVANKNDGKMRTEQSSGQQAPQKVPVEEKDIELQNFGLASLTEIVISTDALREFNSKGLKGFYVFGDTLPGGRLNPNFEFASLNKTTEIISAIDGVVVNIKEQTEVGNKDYEVFIQPKEGSIWTIGYDHLVNLKIKKGDNIKAGDILGNPAPQNNGSYRFELQINKDINGTTHICPSTILESTKRDQLIGELLTMLTAWETQTNTELYDTESQNPVGCDLSTLTPAEAEGRKVL